MSENSNLKLETDTNLKTEVTVSKESIIDSAKDYSSCNGVPHVWTDVTEEFFRQCQNIPSEEDDHKEESLEINASGQISITSI